MIILPLVRHVFQCLKDAVGPRIDGNRGAIAPENLTPVINNEQRTFADAVRFAIGAVALRHRPLGMEVRQQRKVQVAMLGEGLVAPGSVYGEAQELGPVLAKLGKDLVVERHLVAADRTPVGRVEGQDDRSAPQIAEGEPLVGRYPQLEVGSDGSSAQDLRHLALLLPRSNLPRSVRRYVASSSSTLTAVKPARISVPTSVGDRRLRLSLP